MRKIDLNPIDDVLNLIKEKYHVENHIEVISILESVDRVLAEDVISDTVLPSYRKSTVDGYAIKIINQPCWKKLLSDVYITNPNEYLVSDDCIYVTTGSRVPEDADLVVKIEETTSKNDLIYFDVYNKKENIIEKGSDMYVGKKLKVKGSRITTFDIGVFASLGLTEIKVYKRPVMNIITTGDELVEITEVPKLGQIRDINTYTLEALAKTMSIEVNRKVICTDDYNHFKETLLDFTSDCDFIVISGGSSMGKFDYTYDLMTEIGDVFSYGLALKPGKPTITGQVNKTPVFGLPGHPVSAIMVFKILMRVFLMHYHINLGEEFTFERILDSDIYAARGRDTYQMVTVDQQKCYPTSGKSGMITLLSMSDAYTIIPHEVGTIKKGTVVKCYRL